MARLCIWPYVDRRRLSGFRLTGWIRESVAGQRNGGNRNRRPGSWLNGWTQSRYGMAVPLFILAYLILLLRLAVRYL